MISDLNISSIETAIEATGSGHILGHNLSIQSASSGLTFRGPSSVLTGTTHIEITNVKSPAIDILDSSHLWSEIMINKQFSQQDSSSTAVNAWYANVEFNNLRIENFSTGIYLQDSCLLYTSPSPRD